MFRKRVIILLILILCIILTSCSKISIDEDNLIKSPVNNKIPLEGVWTVVGYERLKDSTVDQKELESWIGKKFGFSKDEIVIGEDCYQKPSYKIKNVNSKQFFLYEYGLDSEALEIGDAEITVITILSEDKLLYDIVKYKDELLIVMNNSLFKLTYSSKEKIVESTTSAKTDKENKKIESNESKRDISSGVLLGLRYNEEDKTTGIENIKYRTLWIESEYSSDFPVVQCNELLVPRVSGFWRLGSSRYYKDGTVYDLLNTSSLNRKDSSNKNTSSVITKSPRRISFVGNDYVVSEYSTNSKANYYEYNKIQVLPMDSINKSKGIKFQDIVGELGGNVMLNSAKSFLSTLNGRELKYYETDPKEEDFFLARRNGHWILSGRLYGKDIYGSEVYKDYAISMIPPKSLVSYDDLIVPWNSIKEKNPDAIDAYTSPNEDMALVLTKESLYIYSISNGKISDKYLGKIKLRDNETVVMSEWAVTDNFVNAWRKTIKSIGGWNISE